MRFSSSSVRRESRIEKHGLQVMILKCRSHMTDQEFDTKNSLIEISFITQMKITTDP